MATFPTPVVFLFVIYLIWDLSADTTLRGSFWPLVMDDKERQRQAPAEQCNVSTLEEQVNWYVCNHTCHVL
jgi:hypothetical protein